MAENRTFVRETINLSSETFTNCRFVACTLVCEDEATFMKLKNNQFQACIFEGAGWPDFVRAQQPRLNGRDYA